MVAAEQTRVTEQSRDRNNKLHDRRRFVFAFMADGPQTYLLVSNDPRMDQGGEPWKAKCGRF